MLDTRISRRAALMGAGAVGSLAGKSRARASAGGGQAERSGICRSDLLARMTLEEKAGQLSLMASAWGGSDRRPRSIRHRRSTFPQQVEEARQGQLTGVFNGNGARMARILQTAAVKESRLKIPLIFAADIIHGHRTIFPVPLAEVASFEPELARRTAEAAAFEAAGAGIDWTFSPMVDVARDQRWGRGVEGGGEDVLLGEICSPPHASAASRATIFKANERMLACIKHFAAYGAARGGPRLQYRRHLRAHAARSLSCRLTRRGSTPARCRQWPRSTRSRAFLRPATDWLMTELLRGEWGFEGFVVSDYTGDEEMILHGYRQGRARCGEARAPRRRRHEHAERPLSQASARPGP